MITIFSKESGISSETVRKGLEDLPFVAFYYHFDTIQVLAKPGPQYGQCYSLATLSKSPYYLFFLSGKLVCVCLDQSHYPSLLPQS